MVAQSWVASSLITVFTVPIVACCEDELLPELPPHATNNNANDNVAHRIKMVDRFIRAPLNFARHSGIGARYVKSW
jgi:hypothetical protein